jgi:hypothetical protein
MRSQAGGGDKCPLARPAGERQGRPSRGLTTYRLECWTGRITRRDSRNFCRSLTDPTCPSISVTPSTYMQEADTDFFSDPTYL